MKQIIMIGLIFFIGSSIIVSGVLFHNYSKSVGALEQREESVLDAIARNTNAQRIHEMIQNRIKSRGK